MEKMYSFCRKWHIYGVKYANREDVNTAPYLNVARELLEIRVTYGDKNDPKSHAMAGVTKSVRRNTIRYCLKITIPS